MIRSTTTTTGQQQQQQQQQRQQQQQQNMSSYCTSSTISSSLSIVREYDNSQGENDSFDNNNIVEEEYNNNNNNKNHSIDSDNTTPTSQTRQSTSTSSGGSSSSSKKANKEKEEEKVPESDDFDHNNNEQSNHNDLKKFRCISENGYEIDDDDDDDCNSSSSSVLEFEFNHHKIRLKENNNNSCNKKKTRKEERKSGGNNSSQSGGGTTMSYSHTTSSEIDTISGPFTLNGGSCEGSVCNSSSSEDDDSSTSDDDDSKDSANGGRRFGLAKQSSFQTKIIGLKENSDVFYSRLIVSVVLIVSCITVVYAFYAHTTTTEMKEFEQQFQQNVYKIMELVGTKLEHTFEAIDSLATTVVSIADSSNQNWPYVTISNFPILASKIRSLSLSVFIEMAVVVESYERLQWENYSINNYGWINDTLDIQQTDPTYYGPSYWNVTPEKEIYGDDGTIPYTEIRRFMPSWHMYPAIPIWDQVFNWDWMSDENLPEATRKVVDEKLAILTEPYMLFDKSIPEEAEMSDILSSWFELFINPGEQPNEPMSDIMYPVINVLNRVDMMSDENNNETTKNKERVVASIRVPFYWRDVISDILPFGSNGHVIIFSNPCTVPFSYEINGPEVVYLGQGDFHDPKYDDSKISSNFYNLSAFAVEKSKYTGAEIDATYCPMTLTMYPTDTMQNAILTNTAKIFASIVVFCFVVTYLVLFFYDHKVERRQNKVLKAAAKSEAIVASLFPAHIRDQLLAEESEEQNGGGSATFTKSPIRRKTVMWSENESIKQGEEEDTSKYQLNSFLDFEGNPAIKVDGVDEDDLVLPDPIADFYEEVTVLIAQIDGFDAWSAKSDPKHVFIVLELLHATFDQALKKRTALKIESRDSYIAVSGIPKFRKDHAVIMVRFATDIVSRTTEILSRLENKLDHDVSTLRVRIGMNSGPVTAGMFRSVQSLFQLFGETVTHAERMAVTSTAGRIQCTQKTADLLSGNGKEKWLTKRERLISLSNTQGMIRTYWIKLGAHSSVGGTASSESEHSSDHIRMSGSRKPISTQKRVPSPMTPGKSSLNKARIAPEITKPTSSRSEFSGVSSANSVDSASSSRGPSVTKSEQYIKPTVDNNTRVAFSSSIPTRLESASIRRPEVDLKPQVLTSKPTGPLHPQVPHVPNLPSRLPYNEPNLPSRLPNNEPNLPSRLPHNDRRSQSSAHPVERRPLDNTTASDYYNQPSQGRNINRDVHNIPPNTKQDRIPNANYRHQVPIHTSTNVRAEVDCRGRNTTTQADGRYHDEDTYRSQGPLRVNHNPDVSNPLPISREQLPTYNHDYRRQHMTQFQSVVSNEIQNHHNQTTQQSIPSSRVGRVAYREDNDAPDQRMAGGNPRSYVREVPQRSQYQPSTLATNRILLAPSIQDHSDDNHSVAVSYQSGNSDDYRVYPTSDPYQGDSTVPSQSTGQVVPDFTHW